MRAKEKITPEFLSGGGEMGELIRSFDWSKTSIGSPGTWPQSLRIAVRIMLDCPFGMYIAWGNEYIQLYNDGYRPILGATKHPQALGISTCKTFAEIWPTIGPMFDGVMEGTPVGFPDFILHLDRNGFIEECVFDFSYSPIRLEDGEVGGVLVTVIETTEKVNAVKALKESERRFQNVVREANVGIIVLSGEEMRVEVVNEAYGRLIKLKPDDLLGKPLFDVIPEAQEVFLPILNKVRLSGESLYLYDQAYNLVTNGKKVERYLNVAYQAYKETDGTVSGVIAICHDITETIKNRQKIEEANKQLRTAAALTENIADAVVGTDMDYKTISWNKGAENLYGYAREEVMDKYAMALLRTQFLSEEDQQAWSKDLDATGKWQGEVVQSKKDGTLVSVLVSIAYVYDENGKPIAAVAVNRDITERKKAEEKIAASENQFRIFADSIQNLAWIADSDGWRYWYNQRWYDYTGTTLEEMKGWGWQKVHHPDHIKNVIAFIKEALKKDEAFELTIPLRRYDGEYRWFLTRAYPVKDATGNIERWIGTNTDITEQKMAEQKKDDFISIASHEMKTPLTTAKGYIELLLLSLNAEDESSFLYATKTNQAIGRLNDLVTELLDASKIQNGQMNYTITTVDFNKLLDETIENIQHSAKNHSIQKTGNCSQQISGDRDRLQQVLINLLSNAIKYSPNAHEVLVKIEEQDNKIRVSVQDFGVGMSMQHLDKIFDRYYRVQEHAVHFQGLGIGLYISNNIVERHEGKMWAESEPGKGSIFYFELPL